LQGDFREHIYFLRRLGAEAQEVRLPKHLNGLDGLILPGGESTTIGKLAVEYGLLKPLRELAASGLPMWGTCAGLILLARGAGQEQPLIGALDVVVQRNAFGRQVDSFEADLVVTVLTNPQHPFRAVFIRAPLITQVGPGVEILAHLENENQSQPSDHSPLTEDDVVAVQQGHVLGTAFHPELTNDFRFHQYFLELIER
jgi:5'-phosphate synthase pdxT subunit